MYAQKQAYNAESRLGLFLRIRNFRLISSSCSGGELCL